MSRIGRKAITLPKVTTVTMKGDRIVVNGSKGELETPLMPGIAVAVEDDRVLVSRDNDE
ncbi:MAG: 50S ribosomal protein L6, partial [Synergistaceae bacterium]|nr:50S ribosomal protein L6 [Synergistaceae bacterium]